MKVQHSPRKSSHHLSPRKSLRVKLHASPKFIKEVPKEVESPKHSDDGSTKNQNKQNDNSDRTDDGISAAKRMQI